MVNPVHTHDIATNTRAPPRDTRRLGACVEDSTLDTTSRRYRDNGHMPCMIKGSIGQAKCNSHLKSEHDSDNTRKNYEVYARDQDANHLLNDNRTVTNTVAEGHVLH